MLYTQMFDIMFDISRVWTCFEYCMLKSPDLMRDRHIDQVIMCCTYILAKVNGRNW